MCLSLCPFICHGSSKWPLLPGLWHMRCSLLAQLVPRRELHGGHSASQCRGWGMGQDREQLGLEPSTEQAEAPMLSLLHTYWLSYCRELSALAPTLSSGPQTLCCERCCYGECGWEPALLLCHILGLKRSDQWRFAGDQPINYSLTTPAAPAAAGDYSAAIILLSLL